MTTPVFTWALSYSPQAQRKPRRKKISFGDGYSQRSQDGINSKPEIWNVSFLNRDTTEGYAIDAFLTARGGVEKFEWTTPTGVTANFICEEHDLVLSVGNNVTITGVFEQVFEV